MKTLPKLVLTLGLAAVPVLALGLVAVLVLGALGFSAGLPGFLDFLTARRPPSATQRTATRADLTGTYHYPLQLGLGQVTLVLKADKTFTQVVTPAKGQAPFTVEGEWYIEGGRMMLNKVWETPWPMPKNELSQPLESLGRRGLSYWMILDSTSRKGGFQLLGGDSGPPEAELVLDRDEK